MNEEQESLSEDRDLYEHFSIQVDPGQNPIRIDVFLTHRIPNATRTKVQKGIEAGSVLVNSNVVKSNYKVKPNDVISVVLPEPPRDTEIHPEKMDLTIVYEDDELLIINKPAGMVVHPGYNNYTGTLVHGLVHHFEHLPHRDDITRPGLVHRIDKDTSGLLVIAKTEYALNYLAKQFFDHSIDRNYYALVWGDVKQDNGTIVGNLMRDPKDRRRSVVTTDEEQGKHAITHYEVVERFHFVTLIKCTLETGRTHQIRAHMKYIGHPIFNDEMYGGNVILKGMSFGKFNQFINNCFSILPRQALHAYSLGFEHPKTKKRIYFEADFPEDFKTVLEKLRRYVNSNKMEE
ncbi:MAG: RluA family pseudouridine synthase [Bacteroidia bacterium]|jgi:23S rRNA pseudouridine1911/1915/1917 synthase|nr:RluA family pseudouridine synthase [Bacteroidia bacterium]MCO5253208.1 RluA family pseudouridine synthase [Bacteroidota bacterium]